MPLKIPLRVHIIPLGYEVDRAIEPLRRYKPDRIYLLTQVDEKGVAKRFYNHLARELPKLVATGEFHEVKTSLFDFAELLNTFAEILKREEGNHVYVNASSGGKLPAIAGTIAALMFGARAYYAKVGKYNVEDLIRKERDPLKAISEGVTDIIEIADYTIDRPSSEHVTCLRIILDAGKEIDQKELMKKLQGKGLLKPEARKEEEKPSAGAMFQYFRRNFLIHLEERGWIERKGKIRKARVVLTTVGELTANAFACLSL